MVIVCFLSANERGGEEGNLGAKLISKGVCVIASLRLFAVCLVLDLIKVIKSRALQSCIKCLNSPDIPVV